MSIITIARGSLSGGQALGERVAGRLGYRCVSSEDLIETAAKFGVPEPRLSRFFDKMPSFWERVTRARRLYLLVLQAAMYELARGGKLVYHGQAGQQLLKGISQVIKVRLIAALEDRIHAAMVREELSREAAARYIRQVDEERLRRLRYLFEIDWRQPALYDVVLNLEYMSLETAADVVVYMTGRQEYQPTPVSEHLLDDLALGSWIRASLAVHGIELDVRADGGVVWVTGHVDSSELRKQIMAIAQAVPGAKQVIANL
ncbi:MAG: cytidylate kinase family protein [Nitrospinae bacterium]|nr:cytidylate kinase family protein [Nitrospinota bacterium]